MFFQFFCKKNICIISYTKNSMPRRYAPEFFCYGFAHILIRTILHANPFQICEFYTEQKNIIFFLHIALLALRWAVGVCYIWGIYSF